MNACIELFTDTIVQSGVLSSLDGSLFSKGDVVYVVALANDGLADSNLETSTSVSIQNSIPEIDSIEILPTQPLMMKMFRSVL